MRRISWSRLLGLALSGTIVFQTVSCVDTSAFITAVATVVTAGGVIYLVTRVLE